MEVYANRKEIVRRILARMGYVTNATQAPQTQIRINEYVRAAAHEVFSRCQWAKTQRETFATIGIDQRFLNYPEHATAGNIIQIGVWDAAADRYRPLRRARITVAQDDEPLVEEGEPASVPGRGIPQVYEPKEQIEFWPRADQEYELKIDHTVNPDLEGDGDESIVDAELIILWVLADLWDDKGDPARATTLRGRFERRLGQLRAWASTRQSHKRGRLTRLVNNGARISGDVIVLPGGDLPNSGAWPAVMPT